MLEKEGWLLPPPFPTAIWDAAGTGAASLSLEVNLLAVSPEVTEDSLKNNLNAFLEKRPLFSTRNRDPAKAYKGLTVASAQVVSKPLDTDRTKVTRYLVKTNPYPAPMPTTRPEEKIPTREQVADAIRDYFHQGAPAGQLRLAEPFPQVSTVGPRVASSLQTDALVAVFISIVGIVFYLSLRFEFIYGLAGIIALVHDCMVAIGVMAVTDQFFSTTFPVKLNLNELAAVLTIIGFSINDTIVLFDRIRENLEVLSRRKLTLRDIVDISINQTLARTLWTSTTVFMVDVILLGFGGESVRGFAFVFAVGTVAGVYSSVFIAAPIAIWLHDRSLARRQALATAEA
jgi:preprotein translocase SecF subunit